MIPLPYRIAAIAALIVAVWAFGYHRGSLHVQGQWNAAKAAETASINEAILKRVAENAKQAEAQSAINAAITKAKNEEIVKLSIAYRAARATGLRISAAACNRPSESTAPESPRRANDTPTIGLPPETERRLFELAEDADKCSIQLTTLQKWVHANNLD